MSDNISKMNDKQLRNEVQLLRDELAIMKRKFEDIIYNLDTDNFSSQLIKEKDDMKTEIKVTAEGIKTKVSKTDLDNSLSNYSTISQTAEKIETAVNSVNNTTEEKLKNYSTISQTADKISASVTETKQYVTNLLEDGDYVTNATFESRFNIYADGIYSTVESTYETKDDANSSYSSLRRSISSVSQTAESFETRVSDLETFKTSTFTQTADGFTLDGDKTTFTGVIYLTDENDNKRFSIFHTKSNGLTENDVFERVLLHSCDDYNHLNYIIIGDGTYNSHNVYIGDDGENCLVATQGWVLENAGSGSGGSAVAKFG